MRPVVWTTPNLLWFTHICAIWSSIYGNYLIVSDLELAFCARSKTRKTRKFFSESFKFEFSILAVGQNRKLGNKKTRNNISEISEISELSEFSICHFLIFQKTFFLSIFYSGQFRTFYLCYVLFSKPFKVFFPSRKIYVQNITLP